MVGAAFALWGALGVADAAQQAMNSIWNVPRRRYPSFVLRRLRGLAWLVLLGGGLLAASLAAGVATPPARPGRGWPAWPPRRW